MINLNDLMKQVKGAEGDVGPLRYVAKLIAILHYYEKNINVLLLTYV